MVNMELCRRTAWGANKAKMKITKHNTMVRAAVSHALALRISEYKAAQNATAQRQKECIMHGTTQRRAF